MKLQMKSSCRNATSVWFRRSGGSFPHGRVCFDAQLTTKVARWRAQGLISE
jgi:hypothetical protein